MEENHWKTIWLSRIISFYWREQTSKTQLKIYLSFRNFLLQSMLWTESLLKSTWSKSKVPELYLEIGPYCPWKQYRFCHQFYLEKIRYYTDSTWVVIRPSSAVNLKKQWQSNQLAHWLYLLESFTGIISVISKDGTTPFICITHVPGHPVNLVIL